MVLFLLGTGASSRLNQRIREQLGLVYQIDAWAGRYRTGGYLAVALSLGGANQKQALFETCRILRELPQTITEDELLIAKEKLLSGLVMSREQPHNEMVSCGQQLLLKGHILSDEALLQGIRNVTLPQAKDAAARYLDLKDASLTAVGQTKSKAFYQAILSGEINT